MRIRFLFICLFFVKIIFGQEYLSFSNKQVINKKVNTLPKRIIETKKSNEFTVSYSFENAQIARKNVKNDEYQFLQIEGFSKMNQIGAPALPAHNDLIAIPGTVKPKITIIDAEYIEIEGFSIHPSLRPEVDTEGTPASPFEKDEKIYSQNDFFPQSIVNIENVHKYRNIPLAVVQIRPVQYNPVSHKLRVYSKITYKLEYNSDANVKMNNNSLHALSLIKDNLLNKSVIKFSHTDLKNVNSDPDYIILTHTKYKAAADTLAKWKSQLGYNVEVIARDSWTDETVKSAVHSRYQVYEPKPDYFVILGDHDGLYAIPSEVLNDPSKGEDFASDLYYACMDGSDDYFPDMAHGRISVSSSEEAMNVVLKIVNYERYPVENDLFYKSGLNCAQFQDIEDNEAPDGFAARRFCHTSEEIREYMINEQNYNVERVYYTSYANTPTNYNVGNFSSGEAISSDLLRSNGFEWDGNSQDILSAINAGKFYVFHRDHGYIGGSGWAHPRFVSYNIDALENGDLLPVVFSVNCHTGEFSLENCFAEKFLRKENGGAVGVVAAAYYSYSGNNDAFSTGMVDAIWSNPGLTPAFGFGGTPEPSEANNIRTMGDVVNQGLIRMIQTWGDDKYTHELFHWFGDPAMKIWTENPNNNLFSANIPESINCNETTLTITDCNIENALVTLVVNGKLISKATVTARSATLNFDYVGNSDIPALVTISKENYKPFIANLKVKGSDVYPPKAIFSADISNIAPKKSVQFIDASVNKPDSWFWTFEGGIPSTSTEQNPVVLYNNIGSFDVSLKVSNDVGNDNLVYTDYIVVEERIYCDAYSGQCDESICRVQLNTIDNSSDCDNYQDFTNISTDLNIEGSYEIKITNSKNYTSDEIVCWIDWNQDKDFEDEDEQIDISYSNSIGAGTIAVPANALEGETRMRIRMVCDEMINPCGKSRYGEVEDYTVNIVNTDKYSVTFNINDGTNSIEGANVTLNGYDSEITNNEGIVVFPKVFVGNEINYTVNADGFKSTNGTVELIDSDLIKNIVLDPKDLKVYFIVGDGKKAVSGASITINESTKITDATGKTYFNLPREKFNYTIFADGYEEFKGSVNIVDGDVNEVVALSLKTSIEDFKSENLYVYPNPTSGIINIQGKDLKYSEISVYDLNGKKIISLISKGNFINIDLSNYSSGTYILLIEKDKLRYERHIVKE